MQHPRRTAAERRTPSSLVATSSWLPTADDCSPLLSLLPPASRPPPNHVVDNDGLLVLVCRHLGARGVVARGGWVRGWVHDYELQREGQARHSKASGSVVGVVARSGGAAGPTAATHSGKRGLGRAGCATNAGRGTCEAGSAAGGRPKHGVQLAAAAGCINCGACLAVAAALEGHADGRVGDDLQQRGRRCMHEKPLTSTGP